MELDDSLAGKGASRQRNDLGTFGNGPAAVDWEERVDLETLRRARVQRVREVLDASPADALLVWKDENVRYLTGLRAQIISGKSSVLNGCLLLEGREPILLCSGGDLARVELGMTWIEEFHAIPIQEADGLIGGTIEGTILPLLRQAGIERGRLAIDQAPLSAIGHLRRLAPGLELDDGDALMLAARRIKFREEIALMEEAGAIAEAVTQTAIDAVAPGVRECEVVAEAMHTLYRLGGEMPHVATPFVASGEHMSPPTRLATDKVIREGDLVFIDIGAMWNGYFSDVARTTVCGEPSRRQQEIYTAVYDSLQAGTETMRAGNTNEDVARAIRAAAAKHDLEDRFVSLFIGHGVGIGTNEPPYVGEILEGADTVVLEGGMTFALEPLVWVSGVRGGGGVRLEDTILVDDDGGRPLTRTAFEPRLLI